MQNTKQIKLKSGPLGMMLSAFFFSVMVALIKELSQNPKISLFQMTFFRAAVSAIILIIIMKKRGISFWGNNQKLLFFRAMTGFTAMCLNFYAITKIRLGDAGVLHQTTPFFVILFSALLLKEKIKASVIILTIICFSGIVIILRPSGDVLNTGGLAALGSALFAASAYVSIRHLHQTDTFWTMAFYFMLIASILSFFPMLQAWQTPNSTEWLLLIFIGILGIFGQLLMTYSYKLQEASKLAPFAYFGVIFSFLWGFLFFGEKPSELTLLGASLVVLGGMGILLLKKPNNK